MRAAAPPPGWNRLRKAALGLGLPGVVEATSYGAPALKAHGKLWVWCSPHEAAFVFKIPVEERDMLLEADPERFFVTAHYRPHPLILMRPGKLDLAWAKARLLGTWRAGAPKRLLQAYDARKD